MQGYSVRDRLKEYGGSQYIKLKQGAQEIVLPLIFFGGILCTQLRKLAEEEVQEMVETAILLTPSSG